MEQVEALMIIEIQSYKTEKCRNYELKMHIDIIDIYDILNS